MVTSSVDLNLIQIRGELREMTLTEVVHLVGKDLISVEIVTKESAIRIVEIISFLNADIREGSNFSVERVVLSIGSVEVLSSEAIRSEVSDNVLEEVHGEEIGVSPSGSLEEYSNIDVGHFIVSHHEG